VAGERYVYKAAVFVRDPPPLVTMQTRGMRDQREVLVDPSPHIAVATGHLLPTLAQHAAWERYIASTGNRLRTRLRLDALYDEAIGKPDSERLKD
jgi:hypothetical protein